MKTLDFGKKKKTSTFLGINNTRIITIFLRLLKNLVVSAKENMAHEIFGHSISQIDET